MEHLVTTIWKENLQFHSKIDEHSVSIDALSESNETTKGPSPKKLLLTALAGCTGIDVVSILKKMRVPLQGLTIHIHAQLTDEHPKYYSSFHIIYEFEGNNLEKEKLINAIELSQEKYCGVSYMFKQFATITYEISIHQQ